MDEEKTSKRKDNRIGKIKGEEKEKEVHSE